MRTLATRVGTAFSLVSVAIVIYSGCDDGPSYGPPIDHVTEDGGTLVENPAFSCPSANDAGVTIVPDGGATVFAHTAAQCHSLRPVVIVKNVGTASMQVQALGMADDAFGVGSEPLPVDLAPGNPCRWFCRTGRQARTLIPTAWSLC